MNRERYRAIFVSDLHLGARDAQSRFLLDFLSQTDSDFLYLVGDIIDLWKLRRGWYWPQINNDILRCVLDKARDGTKVVYVPGNHDELLRDYVGMEFNGVRLAADWVHETADGRRLLVLHGDEFDGVVKHNRWLAHIGSRAYDLLLVANRWYNHLRRRLGFDYWSLSAFLKHSVKEAVNYIGSFEDAVAREAARRNVDGLVCGHIHKAAIDDSHGVLYLNCGDWVESCTALVEGAEGGFRILQWANAGALDRLATERGRPAAAATPDEEGVLAAD
jgi:UDP-2,3-diacylglucosamine pyrophosphatase LpxH